MAATKEKQSLGSFFSLFPDCLVGHVVCFGICTSCLTTQLTCSLHIFMAVIEIATRGVFLFSLLMLPKNAQDLNFMPQIENVFFDMNL